MKTKICKKCNEEKDINEFRVNKIKDKIYYRNNCKECERKYAREYTKNNKILVSERTKRWRNNNKEYVKEYNKKYKKNHKKSNLTEEQRKLKLERTKRWRQKNKEHIKKYKREDYYKRKNNELYQIKLRIRNLIFISFKKKGYKKNSKTENILGCDYITFINYLLQTYKNNYGEKWDGIEKVHIDHIIPLSTAKTKEEVIKLNHYTNLQLLKAKDNLQKSDKLNWELGDNL